jgi:hypothetical protein
MLALCSRKLAFRKILQLLLLHLDLTLVTLLANRTDLRAYLLDPVR